MITLFAKKQNKKRLSVLGWWFFLQLPIHPQWICKARVDLFSYSGPAPWCTIYRLKCLIFFANPWPRAHHSNINVFELSKRWFKLLQQVTTAAKQMLVNAWKTPRLCLTKTKNRVTQTMIHHKIEATVQDRVPLHYTKVHLGGPLPPYWFWQIFTWAMTYILSYPSLRGYRSCFCRQILWTPLFPALQKELTGRQWLKLLLQQGCD